MRASRFEPQLREDLLEASSSLLASLEFGGGAPAAEAYFESLIALYDRSGNQKHLKAAADFVRAHTDDFLPTPTWHLAHADLLLRRVAHPELGDPVTAIGEALAELKRAERILSNDPTSAQGLV